MIDRASPTWRAVEAKAKARIEELRDLLERSEDHSRSQLLRGQIKELRELLAMADPKAAPRFKPTREL